MQPTTGVGARLELPAERPEGSCAILACSPEVADGLGGELLRLGDVASDPVLGDSLLDVSLERLREAYGTR